MKENLLKEEEAEAEEEENGMVTEMVLKEVVEEAEEVEEVVEVDEVVEEVEEEEVDKINQSLVVEIEEEKAFLNHLSLLTKTETQEDQKEEVMEKTDKMGEIETIKQALHLLMRIDLMTEATKILVDTEVMVEPEEEETEEDIAESV